MNKIISTLFLFVYTFGIIIGTVYLISKWDSDRNRPPLIAVDKDKHGATINDADGNVVAEIVLVDQKAGSWMVVIANPGKIIVP